MRVYCVGFRFVWNKNILTYVPNLPSFLMPNTKYLHGRVCTLSEKCKMIQGDIFPIIMFDSNIYFIHKISFQFVLSFRSNHLGLTVGNQSELK